MHPSLRRVLAVVVCLVAAWPAAVAGAPLAAAQPGTAQLGTAQATARIRVTPPTRVTPGDASAIRLTLPASASAVEGTVRFADAGSELIGIAPAGAGHGLPPVRSGRTWSFGAYGLAAVDGAVRLDLVVAWAGRTPRATVRVTAVANRTGRRLDVAGVPRRPAATTDQVVALAAGRVISTRDVAVARATWEQARLDGVDCEGGGRAAARRAAALLDVDGNGCGDIVDIARVAASQGRRVDLRRRSDTGRIRDIRPGGGVRLRVASGGPGVLTVDSNADTPDAHPGDGQCADSQGRCTLRAAITESEMWTDDMRIEFAIDGQAPRTIRLAGRLPLITRTQGSLVIDGYSQRGAKRNTAQHGSNAVPGVRIRGNGPDAKETGFYVTGARVTIRGFVLSDLYRGVVIDGSTAVGVRVMGNWIGFDGNGKDAAVGDMGVLVNTGATNTRIGSSALEDRNVIGNMKKGVNLYGPGTHGTVVQGNQLCISPSGAVAECKVGVDHDFGPQHGLIGGSGPGEGNVIGRTYWEGIELSHGWDRSTGKATARWRVADNVIEGNLVGFRQDGRYHQAFRSGYKRGSSDSSGIHLWDGVYDNVVRGNRVASVYYGIRVRTPKASGNRIEGNIVGVAATGAAAPLEWWGISLEGTLPNGLVTGNVVRNAGRGGIGLLGIKVRSVRVSRNIVSATKGPAIHLLRSGKQGANRLQAAPTITGARVASGGVKVTGRGRAGARVEVYRSSRGAGKPGMPVAFLGAVKVTSKGTWSVVVPGVAVGQRVAALQIRSNDDTSEMSKGVAVKR